MRGMNKRRKPWVHKGDYGYVLIIGGSKKYSGSPIFNAISALRAGADLITIAAPQRAADIAASFSPDMITFPLTGDHLKSSHIKEILKISDRFDSLIIGGGLGLHNDTKKAVIKIILEINLPMVIDADAIKVLGNNQNIVKGKQVILTPNTPEFEMLIGQKISNQVKERKNKVKELASKLGVVVLLKGHVDIISDGKKLVLSRSGSAYMTKGGFGDTLAGIAGSLLAQGYKPFEAAKLAAKINGQAGEMACRRYGAGVLASDIFEYIAQVIK